MRKKTNNNENEDNESFKDFSVGKVVVLTEKEISGLKEIKEAFQARYLSPTYRVLETNYGPELFYEIYQSTLH
jgi:hypothetical protein